MPSRPWDSWLPGVLAKAQVQELRTADYITDAREEAIDPSAIDLTLTDKAWVFTEGSVKPDGRHSYVRRLEQDGLLRPLSLERDNTYLLRRRRTYLFRMAERLQRTSELAAAQFYGQATAKSSIGRLDVLARLVVDGMEGYEGFDPEGLARGTGELYLEVTPLTFHMRAKPGISLSQLRLFYGPPSDAEVRGANVWHTVIRVPDDALASRGSLSLDLSPDEIGGLKVAAFCARKGVEDPISLWMDTPPPDPCAYWRAVPASPLRRFVIPEGEFFIFRSKERLWLPPGVAIYCRATDETIGEMRIHYAGFVHPYFGSGRKDHRIGTPLIFEVRGHDFPVNLRDGEQMARITLYRMSRDAEDATPAYTDQELQLSKFFGAWPEQLRLLHDNTVEPLLGSAL